MILGIGIDVVNVPRFSASLKRTPALRDRPEDIPELARHLVARLGKLQGRPLALTDSAVRRLSQYAWPGNVRELENCLERAAVMSPNEVIPPETVQSGDSAGVTAEVRSP